VTRPQPLPEGESIDVSLSNERKRLIHLYMTEQLGPDGDEPEAAPDVAGRPDAVEAVRLTRVEEQARPASRAQPAAEPRPRRRRGRPPGRKKRRQVHFHVDADEDRLLLAAARQFGSQQKGLVAALHALQEVLELRKQVTRLQQQYERQRVLLAEAEALFNKQ
jgi:hypothetical protein